MNKIKNNHNDNLVLIDGKTSNSQLSSLPLPNSTYENDERLELIEISKGLIEILQNSGFTIETLLKYEPSEIAEILGIDAYIGEIIHRETKKMYNNMKSNFFIN
jgi:hypothetical protein